MRISFIRAEHGISSFISFDESISNMVAAVNVK